VLRWALHTDPNKLNLAQLTDLEALVSQYTMTAFPTHLPKPKFSYYQQPINDLGATRNY